jgi:ferredoxin-type protein NapG
MTSSIGRRDLFRLGGQKVVEIASQLATAKAASRAEGWVRPPFALEELDFLLSCTRCDKCIEACPHDVLFKLSARAGLQAAGTPAMDLLQYGCHMCADWPCVAVCEPGALRLPEGEAGQPPAAPKFAVATIDRQACLPYLGPECGACADSCPVPGALDWEDGVRPVIDQESCTGCALCREACILDPKAIRISALVPGDKSATAS